MPTNKQDKRDGPTTEEQKPYLGTPRPCTSSPPTSLSLSISFPYLSSLLSFLGTPSLFISCSFPFSGVFLVPRPPLLSTRLWPLQSKEEGHEERPVWRTTGSDKRNYSYRVHLRHSEVAIVTEFSYRLNMAVSTLTESPGSKKQCLVQTAASVGGAGAAGGAGGLVGSF